MRKSLVILNLSHIVSMIMIVNLRLKVRENIELCRRFSSSVDDELFSLLSTLSTING